jgi:hypothetical protein
MAGMEFRMSDPTFTIVLQADPDVIHRALDEIGVLNAEIIPGRIEQATDAIPRESIIEALRDAHRNDSAADAVEFVSDLVGWSAEDDPECST